MTVDEMVVWHHRLDGHEFEQALGDDEGQGGLACHSLWGHKQSDMTERLNNNNLCSRHLPFIHNCSASEILFHVWGK